MTAQPFETGRCFLKRVVLPALVLAALELGVERLCSAEIDDPSQAFRVSLSISPFSGFMLAQGVTFVDGKVAATTLEELQQLYVAYGATELYARINTRRVHPGGPADHSLERGLEKARLAKRLGIPFNPELGLFRTYGDIRCQTPPDFSDYSEIDAPSPWMSLSMDQMTPLLRKYGAVGCQGDSRHRGQSKHLEFGQRGGIRCGRGCRCTRARRRCLCRRRGSGVVPFARRY